MNAPDVTMIYFAEKDKMKGEEEANAQLTEALKDLDEQLAQAKQL